MCPFRGSLTHTDYGDGTRGADVVQDRDDLAGIPTPVVELDAGHFQGAVLKDRVPSHGQGKSSGQEVTLLGSDLLQFVFLLVGRFRFHQFLSVSPPDHLGRRQPGVRVESTGQDGVGSVEES